jgi:hypothetical protein
MPVTVGVPEIVIVPANQEAVTPEGRPVAVPMPVAMVVECVMFVNIVFTVNVGLDDAAVAVLSTQGVTVLVVAIVGEGPTIFVASTVKI